MLLFLPALAALSLALGRFSDGWQQVRMAEHVSQSIDVSATMNALVATLHAERGASGVYLASNGNRFAQRLAQLPELSDLLQQLGELNALRHRVDQQSVNKAGS